MGKVTARMLSIGGGKSLVGHSQHMAKSQAQEVRKLVELYFDKAKFWWGSNFALKSAVACSGMVFVYKHFSSVALTLTLAFATLAAELFQWLSDFQRSRAEGLKRKFEFHDSFAWPISKLDISDFWAELPQEVKTQISLAPPEDYFDSKEPAGPKRALENLQESAWWSKHLSSTMALLCGAIMLLLNFLTIAALVVSASTVQDFATLQSVNRVAISLFATITSFGFVKLTVSYWGFSKKAEQSVRNTEQLLKDEKLSEIDALKLLHEYQISRASAPLIPGWLWRMRRSSLNESWARYSGPQKLDTPQIGMEGGATS